MHQRKPKVHFSTLTNLYWPCLCLSFSTHLLHFSVVHGAPIIANAEVLSTLQIALLCPLVLTVLDMLTSAQQGKKQNRGKITYFEHCKCIA